MLLCPLVKRHRHDSRGRLIGANADGNFRSRRFRRYARCNIGHADVFCFSKARASPLCHAPCRFATDGNGAGAREQSTRSCISNPTRVRSTPFSFLLHQNVAPQNILPWPVCRSSRDPLPTAWSCSSISCPYRGTSRLPGASAARAQAARQAFLLARARVEQRGPQLLECS